MKFFFVFPHYSSVISCPLYIRLFFSKYYSQTPTISVMPLHISFLVYSFSRANIQKVEVSILRCDTVSVHVGWLLGR